jgi:hypothetical protein
MSSFVSHWIRFLKKHWALCLVLLLGLTNGLIFVFLIPPWQHYDEPNQFEYAWLIANQPGLPKPGTYDQAMRRELAASMIEHDFFRGMGFKSNLLSENEPIWIGISQINNAPLYYWLTALPLRLFRGTDITFQLYIARLVSLFLYLIIILASYGIMTELVPPAHPLRWIVPITAALLASFTNLMTAVNDDVGATALFSLFLWVSIRSIRRGFSWLYLLELLILTVLGFYTKSTISFTILLIPLVLLFSVLRGPKRRIVWIVLVIVTFTGLLLTFNWGEVALWYRQTTQSSPTYLYDLRAPLGSHVLALTQEAGSVPSRMVQVIPNSASKELRGKKVTLGMWIWANKPVQIQSPILNDGVNLSSRVLDVEKNPSFFTIPAVVDESSKRLQIILSPQPSTKEGPITVYYDGIVLTVGSQQANAVPRFNDINAQEGYWGKIPFNNLIRNASFEMGWIRARPWVESLLDKYSPVPFSLISASLMDWPVSKEYFLVAGQQIFRTFWGKFGWGQVAFYGGRPYLLLLILTIAGLAGAAIWLLRHQSGLPWEIIFLLCISLLLIWGATAMRGLTAIFGSTFIPSAHYASPAIIPTLLVLCIGWLELFRSMTQRAKFASPLGVSLYILFLAGLEIYSIISIMIYYRG